MTIGEKIYTLRTNSGMTQEQLAEKMGVSRQAISKWESDVSIPELHKLKALANLFHVTLDELMGNKPQVEEAREVDDKVEKKNNSVIKIVQVIHSVTTIILAMTIIIQSISITNIKNDIYYLQAECARLASMVSYTPSEPTEYLFQEYDYNLGEIDEETKTIKFSFSCVPKQFSEITKIMVSHEAQNGEIYNMELEGENGIYKGEMDLPICTINKTLLIQEDEDVRNVEVVYNLVDAVQEIYPSFQIKIPSKNPIKELEISLASEYEIVTENVRKIEDITVQLYGGKSGKQTELLWEKTLTEEDVKHITNDEVVKLPVDMIGGESPGYVFAKIIFEHALLDGEQVLESVVVTLDEYKASTYAIFYLYYESSTLHFQNY